VFRSWALEIMLSYRRGRGSVNDAAIAQLPADPFRAPLNHPRIFPAANFFRGFLAATFFGQLGDSIALCLQAAARQRPARFCSGV